MSEPISSVKTDAELAPNLKQLWNKALAAAEAKNYGYAVTNLPTHYRTGVLNHADNTPANNQITNEGATLGRVLFYDKQLSHNYGVACASCHTQQTGFSDENAKSQGDTSTSAAMPPASTRCV